MDRLRTKELRIARIFQRHLQVCLCADVHAFLMIVWFMNSYLSQFPCIVPVVMNGDATSEEITHFSSRQTGKHHVRNEKLEQDRLKIGQTDVDVDVDVVAMDTSPLVPTECSTHGPNTGI